LQFVRFGLEKESDMRSNACVVILVVLSLSSGSLVAQDMPVAPEGTQVATEQTPAAASNADELRKAAQNPLASLISVPVQNNNNFGIDPGYRTQDVLNIQPVIPAKVSDNWNLIIRWITPIIYQPLPAPSPAPQAGVYGLGDMQPTFLLSPSKFCHDSDPKLALRVWCVADAWLLSRRLARRRA
jgi:hypothetical protein